MIKRYKELQDVCALASVFNFNCGNSSLAINASSPLFCHQFPNTILTQVIAVLVEAGTVNTILTQQFGNYYRFKLTVLYYASIYKKTTHRTYILITI